MLDTLKKAALATAVTLALTGTAFAQASLSNGSISANLDASGNFDSSTGSGSPGLTYNGVEYINWGAFSSWYWLETTSPAGSFLAQYGSNPLGATTTSISGGLATTFAMGDLNVRMFHELTQANQMTTTVTLTNAVGGSGAVTGVLWAVGFDPDQEIPGAGTFVTRNEITGVGTGAAVMASGATATAVTLANTTGAGAFDVKAFINVGDCCSAVSASTALAGGQALGFSSVSDSSISLGYDLGDIADGQSISFGYSYTFANPVPEPETYAMLLAGLGLMGFMARRRQRNLAAA